jgi:hypothetical protein
MSNGWSPLDPFFWMFRSPFSGNVSENIAPTFSPSLTVDFAGNPKIEDRVVREVASYGSQLGWLTEIVLAWAAGETPPEDPLGKLRKASAAIDEIKDKVRQSALEEANTALDRLKRDQPDAYRSLLRERREAQKTPKAPSGD